MKLASIFIILILFASAEAKSTIYKWVDSSGKVHYSDKPQPKSKETAEIRLRSDIRPEDSEKARAKLDAIKRQQKINDRVNQINTNNRKFDQVISRHKQNINTSNCKTTLRNLSAINKKAPLIKGREYLSDEDRAIEKQKAQSYYENNC
jgi:uncharacterized protein DUF4124